MRVRRETVAEQSVQLLRNQILERKLLPGDAVTEEAMARDIGISRPTMREALNTLIVEGLLTRNPTTRVLHVTRISAQKIREIYRTRRLLEVGGIDAVIHVPDTALEPLSAATEQLVASVASGDGPAVVRADIACHVSTVALIGSSDLTNFYARQLAKLQLAMAEVVQSADQDTQALRDDHQRFLWLMRERQVEEATAHLLERLNYAERQLLDTVKGAEQGRDVNPGDGPLATSCR